MKTINVHGMEFEVMHNSAINIFDVYDFKKLDDCYQKPSAIKKAIYSELVEFVENTYKHFDCDCVREYGIKSFNVFQFTFGALIPVEYNEAFGKDFNYGRFVWCYIEITKMHNRIWAVL